MSFIIFHQDVVNFKMLLPTASISSSLLETIVENLCILLTSKTREVVKAALGFMKVLLSAYPDTVLAPHLKQIVSLALGTKSQVNLNVILCVNVQICTGWFEWITVVFFLFSRCLVLYHRKRIANTTSGLKPRKFMPNLSRNLGKIWIFYHFP